MRLVTVRGDGDLIIRTGASGEPGRWVTGYRAKLRAWRMIISDPTVFPAFGPSFSADMARARHAAAVAAVDAAVLQRLEPPRQDAEA